MTQFIFPSQYYQSMMPGRNSVIIEIRPQGVDPSASFYNQAWSYTFHSGGGGITANGLSDTSGAVYGSTSVKEIFNFTIGTHYILGEVTVNGTTYRDSGTLVVSSESQFSYTPTASATVSAPLSTQIIQTYASNPDITQNIVQATTMATPSNALPAAQTLPPPPASITDVINQATSIASESGSAYSLPAANTLPSSTPQVSTNSIAIGNAYIKSGSSTGAITDGATGLALLVFGGLGLYALSKRRRKK